MEMFGLFFRCFSWETDTSNLMSHVSEEVLTLSQIFQDIPIFQVQRSQCNILIMTKILK